MSETSNEIVITVIIGTIVLFLIISSVVIFILFYQRRQFINKEETLRIRTNYELELLNTQLEVQEQTLTRIGHEIHDNVGQTLAVVRLYLAGLKEIEWNGKPRLEETDKLVGIALHELRNLSHSLNADWLNRAGLIEALRNETDRITQSKKVKARIEWYAETPALDTSHELVLFRICQEALANAIKHSEANTITIRLENLYGNLLLSIIDNGNGQLSSPGNGIINMKRRASMIGATLDIESRQGKGTNVVVKFPVHMNSNIILNAS